MNLPHHSWEQIQYCVSKAECLTCLFQSFPAKVIHTALAMSLLSTRMTSVNMMKYKCYPEINIDIISKA